MPNYDQETCVGRLLFHATDLDTCGHGDTDKADWPDRRDRCDLFAPTPECRKVRALEEIANYAGEALIRYVGGQVAE